MKIRAAFVIGLFSILVVGCSGSTERVVGESNGWTMDDYKKARDAEEAKNESPAPE